MYQVTIAANREGCGQVARRVSQRRASKGLWDVCPSTFLHDYKRVLHVSTPRAKRAAVNDESQNCRPMPDQGDGIARVRMRKTRANAGKTGRCKHRHASRQGRRQRRTPPQHDHHSNAGQGATEGNHRHACPFTPRALTFSQIDRPAGELEESKGWKSTERRDSVSGVLMPDTPFRWTWVGVTAALILTCAAAATTAQTNTGEISGVVRDSQGGVLPGATVVAEHVESATRVERVTDEQGRYFLPSLRVGTYLLAVELAGFRRVVRSGLVVQLGQTLSLDVTLEVGGLTEEIRVTGDVPLLQSTNAEISDVIENRQVVQIPLNGRNFLALAQLSDSVVIPPGGTRGDALQQAGPLPNVGGQRSGHNIYLLDGVKVTDELFNNLVINPSVESIQEFKIQKSQYPAEFGGKASALINVATRAGTNAFHGSLFEFLRHDMFDARNYFDPPDQFTAPDGLGRD